MNQELRNPGLAAILSFVFNGLGQLYNGQILKGLVIIFFSSLSMLIFILGSILIGLWILGKIIFQKELFIGLVLFCLGLILICIIGIYSIFDAYRVASKK
jgi:TM2 domain-containing membrane protein YozV